MRRMRYKDIKPENLLLDHESRSKRRTKSGTVAYLAPEMVENKAHDHAVDNWTLGVLTHEFFFGVPPFEAENQADTFKGYS